MSDVGLLHGEAEVCAITAVMIPLHGTSRLGFSGSCRGDGGMKVEEEGEGEKK